MCPWFELCRVGRKTATQSINRRYCSSLFSTALAKVEAATGQSPSLHVVKAEQKMLALTADALKLDHNQAEANTAETAVVKPVAHVEPVRFLPAFRPLNTANLVLGCQNPISIVCCHMTSYELLRWLVWLLSRDVHHYRMMNVSRSTMQHCSHATLQCYMVMWPCIIAMSHGHVNLWCVTAVLIIKKATVSVTECERQTNCIQIISEKLK